MRSAFAGVAGPEAILAGSCSTATRGQIERHAGGATRPSASMSTR